jgi:hypothetical protein
LKGPYQCFFDHRQFTALAEHLREDYIYVGARMHERLVQNGWTVESLS